MPRVEIEADSGNVNLATLLGDAAPVTGWARSLVYQADANNTDVVKIGPSTMTADDYDLALDADESGEDSPSDSPRMLRSRYVRNDNVSDSQFLMVSFEMS